MTSIVLAQLELAYPSRLMALLLIPVLLYFAVFSGKPARPWRHYGAALCRCVIVGLLILAWTQPALRGPTGRKFVVFVQDVSTSVEGEVAEPGQRFVSDAETGQGDHQTAFLAFGSRPGSLQNEFSPAAPDLERMASDPAAAVLLAAASVPADYVPEVVLQTDGRETNGDLFKAAQVGVPIHVVPLAPFTQPEVCVVSLDGPSEVFSEQTFDFDVVVEVNRDGNGLLQLYYGPLDDVTMEPESPLVQVTEREVQLVTGTNHFQVTAKMAAAATAIFQARLSGVSDTFAQNNQRSMIVFARSRHRVLLVAGENSQAEALARSFQNSAFDPRLETVDTMPATAADLQTYDLIVLCNVSDAQLGNQRLEALDGYLRGGGGLIVAGGEATFGAERYRETALQRLLPVRAGTAPPAAKRSIALVLVIDKSKSMREENRLALAKEAAKRTVDLKLLTEKDKVGVLAFGDDTQWISPIVPCDDKAKLKGQIDGLKATGFTNMFPALQRAFLAISEAHADRRHVIVLTDGVPSPGDFGQIAEQMAEAGITMSAVSVGAGADRTILKDIARRAGGDYEHCESAEQLSEALVKQARSAVTAEVEHFKPFVARQLPGLRVKTAPALTRYASTGRKPQVEQLLLIGAGDPLLAWWRYGSGVAVAFTSAGGWEQAWQSWPGYADFWLRLAELARRRSRPQPFDIRIQQTAETGRLVLDTASAEGAWLNGSSAELRIQRATASGAETLAIPQIAPGRYAQNFAVAESDRLKLTTAWSNSAATANRTQRGITRDYPDELRLGIGDESLLRDVAAVSGGKYQPSPEQVFVDDGRTVECITPLWRHLVLASLLLFVVDVGLRRWLV